jgi:hypothetical protein
MLDTAELSRAETPIPDIRRGDFQVLRRLLRDHHLPSLSHKSFHLTGKTLGHQVDRNKNTGRYYRKRGKGHEDVSNPSSVSGLLNPVSRSFPFRGRRPSASNRSQLFLLALQRLLLLSMNC